MPQEIDSTIMATQQIVIVGAGFAGVNSALAAARLIDKHKASDNIKITLIAPDSSLVIRPRLYQENAANFAAPLDDLFAVIGVEFVKGKVSSIDVAKRAVEVDGGTSVSYDRLILAAGSQLALPDIPGVAEHSFNSDQLWSAGKLDEHLKGLGGKPASDARNTVVVCGGGFTGIEVATEMPARLRHILGKDSKTRVVMVDRNTEVGHTLGDGPREPIKKALQKLDVEVKLNTSITSVDADGVTLSSGEHIPSHTVIWTGGMKASPLTSQIPGEQDALGRLIVDKDLRVPLAKEVFATGDTAHASTDEDGNICLMSCQHAMVLGRFSGYNAAADLLGVPTRPYRQSGYQTCLDLGSYGAVLTSGWDRKVVSAGIQAKVSKKLINTVIIYPPSANKREAFAAGDPDFSLPSPEGGVVQAMQVSLWPHIL